jgi:hypothetical protein
MAGGGLGDGEDVATRGRIDLVSIQRDLDQSDRAPAVGEAHIQVPTVGCHGHAEQAALALDHHQLGQVQQRPRIQAAVADDPHPSGSLADVQGGVIVGDGQRHRLAQPGQPVQPHRHAVELGLGRRPGRGRGGRLGRAAAGGGIAPARPVLRLRVGVLAAAASGHMACSRWLSWPLDVPAGRRRLPFARWRRTRADAATTTQLEVRAAREYLERSCSQAKTPKSPCASALGVAW